MTRSRRATSRQPGGTNHAKERKGILGGLERSRQLLIAAGAIAGAALTIIGLVTTVLPHHAQKGPPLVARQANIRTLALDSSAVERREYCASQDPTLRDRCLSNGRPTDLGDVYEVDVALNGYPVDAVCCQIRYTIYEVDAGGRRLNALTHYDDLLAIDQITPRNELGDTRTFGVWVPYVRPGRFRVEFKLFDQDGQTASAQTEPFDLRG